jgi:hypothetical protein
MGFPVLFREHGAMWEQNGCIRLPNCWDNVECTRPATELRDQTSWRAGPVAELIHSPDDPSSGGGDTQASGWPYCNFGKN